METKLVRRNTGSTDGPKTNRIFRFTEHESLKEEEKQGRFQTSASKLPMSPNENRKDGPFWIAVVLSQAIGLTCIGLVIFWAYLFGGFGWNSSAEKQFYWHPFCMILGLIFFYGDAIIIYRVLSFLPKKTLKVMHGSLHVCAITSASIGLAAVLENHRRKGYADFYSLHSWIGIGTFAFFCLQYIGGFITFLFPGLPMSWKTRMMPFHVFFGIGLFVMAVGSAQIGLTEKLMWVGNYSSGANPIKGVIGNTLGLGLIVFAFLIIFIATNRNYKRKPHPSEVPMLGTN